MNTPATRTKAAISVWNGRIAPVFDVGRRLLVLEIGGGRILNRTEIDLAGASAAERVQRLVQLGARVLVCGAVSRPVLALLHGNGIRVHPFVAGDVDEIIEALLRGDVDAPLFRMPGCGRRRRFRGGRGVPGRGDGRPPRRLGFSGGFPSSPDPPMFSV